MSNVFGQNVDIDNEAKGGEDIVGGFKIYPTDIYQAKIVNAYAENSGSSKAMGLHLELELSGHGKYRETIWVSNGQGQNYYTDKNNEKRTLPGFNEANALAYLAANKALSELAASPIVIKVKDRELDAEVNKTVQSFPELIGKNIAICLAHQIVNRNAKNESTGKYEPTAETREENRIEKILREDGVTFNEFQANDTSLKFATEWKKVNEGKVFNRVKQVAGATAGTAAGGTGAASGGLFSKPN
ncbi:hypothetical protein FF38_10508 [Lucilia cuprina]|uniref:Uncharacterized protein n=1 Tax=Lucilia cuprina TaxID=7375 RepID=A0A0L0CE60_LUCCU|nr:hypothetical protein FF38_10508 [Lucilia cuprina]